MIVTDDDLIVFKQAYYLQGRPALVDLLAWYGERRLREIDEERAGEIRAELMNMAGMPMNAACTRASCALLRLLRAIWK